MPARTLTITRRSERAPAKRRTIRPQAGPQEKFLSTSADIAIYGGAAGGGKTWALLYEALRHTKNPEFGYVIFRRTSPQIRNQGGLWDESMKLYPLAGATPVESRLDWYFPSGAWVGFTSLQYEADVLDFQGSQLPAIGFDELTHFTERQFWYMLSRNRSLSGIKGYVRATCNPDADSWVAQFISWWIDPETGYAIPERSGVLRWFMRVNDELHWADSADELRERFAHLPPEVVQPKSVTFIAAKLSDNQELMRADPQYLANLLALPLVERERLLGGNWKIRPAAGLIFPRGRVDIVPAAPKEATFVRYWDKAGSDGKGDWTVGVLMAREKSTGLYYVCDVIRGQWGSAERERIIKQTAQLDGRRVRVWIEQEPGSGGKESAESTIRNLAGYRARADRVTGSKVVRADPLSAQWQAGNVRIVAGAWNGLYLAELDAFDGKDAQGRNDDQVDASSGAFNRLADVRDEDDGSEWTTHTR